MATRGKTGSYLIVGALWLTQCGGVQAQDGVHQLAAGPSQGQIPKASQVQQANQQQQTTQQAATNQGGGGGGRIDGLDDNDQVDLDQRGGGGNRAADTAEPTVLDHPLDSPGGGGGVARPANVIPVMGGNPNGVDAVPNTPSREGGGGGGGGATNGLTPGVWMGPNILVFPDPDGSVPQTRPAP